MRDDFAIFILTHGRPDRQPTVTSLRRAGYTGKLFYVIDDEDETGNEYRARYGSDNVLEFSKAAIAPSVDIGDNTPGHSGVVYARNAAYDLAATLNLTYFGVFDDDYTTFKYRMYDHKNGSPYKDYNSYGIHSMDQVLESLINFLDTTPVATVAMQQGGDAIGGPKGAMAKVWLKRKAMNSFICATDRRITYMGRINEDVNAYVLLGSTGTLFYTYTPLQLEQLPTQSNPQGLTDLYLDAGTYVKSFYTLLYRPASVTIQMMGTVEPRLHHRVNWNQTVPKLVSESLRNTPN